MKTIIFLLSVLVSCATLAATTPFNTFVNGLSAASTPAGTETVPCIQGGTSKKCTTAQLIQVPSAAFTTLCNPTNASSTLIQCDPLTVSLMGATTTNAQLGITLGSNTEGITIVFTTTALSGSTSGTLTGNFSGTTGNYFVAFQESGSAQELRSVLLTNGSTSASWSGPLAANLSQATQSALGGLGVIDGVTPTDGMTVVLFSLNTTSVAIDAGVWTLHSGPWTYAKNWPSGVVLPANCNIAINITQGTAFRGHLLRANVASISTVGTTSINISDASIPLATTSTSGYMASVTDNQSGTILPGVVFQSSFALPALNDCISSAGTTGTIKRGVNAAGNRGPCVVSDAFGHPIYKNSTGTTTASSGTIGCAASDSVGCVTGLSAATALTITFANSFAYTPSCNLYGGAVAVLTTTSAVGSCAFTMSAFTGTVSYEAK